MADNDVEVSIGLSDNGIQSTMGGLDAVLAALEKIDKSVQECSGKMDNFGKHTGDAMEQAGKKSEGLIDKFAKIGLAIDGVKNIVSSVASSIAPIFEAGLEREDTEAVFGKLFMSPEKGKEYAKKLRESVEGQLYGADVVGGIAQQMMSFNIDQNVVDKILPALGDIAGGDAEKMESLGLAFAQMSSTGKLMGQDLMQMINAGFNPLSVMSETTGKSISELKDEMSKGAISAEDVTNAFIDATKEGGKFHDMAKSKLGGLSGVLKQINAQWEEVKIAMFEALKPIAEDVLPVVVGLMKRLVSFLKSPAFPFFSAIFGSIALAMKTYGIYTAIAAKWTTIMTAKQWLLNLAMDANPIGLVIAAITALVAGIAICIKKYDEWGAALSLVLGPFGIIINLVQSFRRNWDSVVTAFQSDGILAGIKRIGQVILDSILYPLQQLLEILSNIPGMGGLAGKGASKLAEMRKNLNLVTPQKIIPGKEGDENMGGKKEGASGTGTDYSATETAKATKSVSAGGNRNTSITFNLQSLVHQISYNSSISEAKEKTTSDIQEALLRVLYAAESASN